MVHYWSSYGLAIENIVKFVLKSYFYSFIAGADLTLRGDDGMTCLHLAAQSGHLECVHVILGQNNLPRKFINLQDEGGWTPLGMVSNKMSIKIFFGKT